MQTAKYLGVERYIPGPNNAIDQAPFLDSSSKHAKSRDTIVTWRKKVPGSGAMVSMAYAFFKHFMEIDDEDQANKSAQALVDLLQARTSKESPLDIEPVPLLNDKGVPTGYIIGLGTWLKLFALVDFANYDVNSHVTKKKAASASKAAEMQKASAPTIDVDLISMLMKSKANISSSAGSNFSVAPSNVGYGADSAMNIDAPPSLPHVNTAPQPPASMPAVSHARAPPPMGAMPVVSQARAPPPMGAMPVVSQARAPPPMGAMPTVSHARAPPPPGAMPAVSNATAPPPPGAMPVVSRVA